MKIQSVRIDDISQDPANVRKHDERNLSAIVASLRKFGQQKPIVVNADGIILAGNGTYEAAKRLGWEKIDIVRSALKGADATGFAIADNRTAELAEWDETALAETLRALQSEEFDVEAAGFTGDELDDLLEKLGSELAGPEENSGGGEGNASNGNGSLADRFGIPPFSVLNAREGWWQDRKRAWLDLGIRSELGRGAAPGGAPRPLDRGWSGEKSFPAVPGIGTADPAPIHKDIDHYRHKEGKRPRKEAAHG